MITMPAEGIAQEQGVVILQVQVKVHFKKLQKAMDQLVKLTLGKKRSTRISLFYSIATLRVTNTTV